MKQYNLRLTDEQYEWLRDKAYEERKSMAEIVRELIEEKNREV